MTDVARIEQTGADSLVEALTASGVDVVFANLGSDHPAIIESLAKRRDEGEGTPVVVLAPHEASALAAAHGYTLATGKAQAVFVHVDVGTANLGGAVHNASRAHIPVLLFAGLTPFTLEGELPGGRNSYPNHLQDVSDQHGIVRSYVKWSYDIRTGANARQIVARALQIAESAPQGPVYVTAAREVLAARSSSRVLDTKKWQSIAPVPMAQSVVHEIMDAIASAEFPLIVTSSLGRAPEAVAALVEFAELMGVGVVEPVLSALSFPADHDLHLGYAVEPLLDRADVVVAIDTDAPWMPLRARPRDDCRVYVIDSDPLKEGMPLWYIESDRNVRADPGTAIGQLAAEARGAVEVGRAADRRRVFAAEHASERAAWHAESAGVRGLAVPTVCQAILRAIDESTIVLNEAISNAESVFRHLPRSRPGTLFASGGSSLGWSIGAAVGLKLARPDSTIVAIVGDGSFFLGEPSSAYWMARRYETPFLTVILDNGGWNATKKNVIRQYPDGVAATTDRYWVNLDDGADLPAVAAACGGAFAATATTEVELDRALADALAAIRGGRPAVICARLDRVSEQRADGSGRRGELA